MTEIRFIERRGAFDLSPALAAWVADWQAESFVLDDHLVEAGETVWLDLEADEPSELTADEAARLNADTRAEFDRLLDAFPGSPDRAPPAREIIAEPDCRSMRGIGGAEVAIRSLYSGEQVPRKRNLARWLSEQALEHQGVAHGIVAIVVVEGDKD